MVPVAVFVGVLELVERLVFGVQKGAVLGKEVVIHYITEHLALHLQGQELSWGMTYHYLPFIGLAQPFDYFLR